MVKLFFSYSHRDEELRNELEIHLSSLKRQGIIESWHDRRIGAGKEFGNEISSNLEDSQIILLLISPYFIASDYCYEIEMKRAMEKHREGSARVIPVILHPSDWYTLPFGNLMAIPTDGKPVSKFPNQHEAFLDITQAIRKVAEEFGENQSTQNVIQTPKSNENKNTQNVAPVRSSNLRVKKTFSDRERDEFENSAFEYIANYFEGSLNELKSRNPQIDFNFKRIDANHFTAIVYFNDSEASSCSIGLSSDSIFNGIAYSEGRSVGRGINDSFSVVTDGYQMFLKPLGFFNYSDKDELFSFEGAAEHYWQRFIRPLQQ